MLEHWKVATALAAALAAAAFAAGAAAAGGGVGPGVLVGWDGLLAPDGKTRLVALMSDGTTTLARIRVHGGRVVRWGGVQGDVGIPLVAYDGSSGALSADGRRLVLASFTSPPEAGAQTEFAVVDARTFRVRDRIMLDGAFSFDAISPDGRYLFVTEYLPSEAPPGPYRIRVADLRTARLLPGAIVDRDEPGAMQGEPVTRLAGPGGRWAYTLYASRGGHHFLHALDTVRRVAVCVDLPWHRVAAKLVHRVRMRQASATQLELYQPGRGRLAAVDTRSFGVVASAEPAA
jgi:hypothetical protein